MSKAFPPKETSDFYTRLAAGFGKIEKFDVPTGGYRGWIAFQLHCQRGELTMSLALDATIKSPEFISSPRPSLPWICNRSSSDFSVAASALARAFLLAGLLYSWLLQKLTKRAWGSALWGFIA